MHIYKNSKGDILPSVTEIIQRTRLREDVESMEKAIENKKKRNNMTDSDWEEYMKKAQDRGTSTHLYFEEYLPLVEKGNKEILVNGGCSKETFMSIKECRDSHHSHPEYGKYCESITKFIYELNQKTRNWKVLSSEMEVINETMGYGGRTDLLIEIEGESTLIDLKTNGGYWDYREQAQVYKWQEFVKGFRASMVEYDSSTYWDWVDKKLKDKFIQLALYIEAINDMRKTGSSNLDEIQKASILVAFPGTYQYIKMPTEAWHGCFTEALARVDLFMLNQLDSWRERAVDFMKSEIGI